MENFIDILKLLIVAALALGYIVKILKGKQADGILTSLITTIEQLGNKPVKQEISKIMRTHQLNHAKTLDNKVQTVVKSNKKNALWDVIKIIVPFVL